MIYLFPAFLATSIAYSSVGLAGGSMYLAIMALSGISYVVYAPLALGLNAVVAIIGWKNFSARHGFRKDVFIPLACASVPASFIGGFIRIESAAYLALLSSVLIASAIAMVVRISENVKRNSTFIALAATGSLIGLVSGVTGIGGGLFLTPVILFLGIVREKEAASISAAFIVLNSLSGLAGHVLRGNVEFLSLLPYLSFAVIAGGFSGSYIGSAKLPPAGMRLVFSGILAFVGITTLWRAYALL